MNTLSFYLAALADYAVEKGLAEEGDRAFLINSLLALFGENDFEAPKEKRALSLEELLSALCDLAYERGLIEENTTAYRDLFDTALMGALVARPSEVTRRFFALYEKDRRAATDYFYALAKDSDYIRTYRVEKDVKWSYPSPYGDIDITINLSKPEKDPTAIAAAKLLPASAYPKCLLCHENEGYAGSLRSPARQNLRQIPFSLGGEQWYMQYSPYVYYNEHCILLSSLHTPMKISEATFRRALDFVDALPHYFIGSNADLPIVGGSILSHDHMQGGAYSFAMERAEEEIPLSFLGYEDVSAAVVRWPLSVIRIRGEKKERLVSLADKILTAWRDYTDEDAFVYAETDGEKHNTLTPIARRRGDDFELDLVLRNNITTEEHPLGVYHPHAEKHHIKKENIGLIEVMGLAVLPARLKEELSLLAEAMLSGRDLYADPVLSKHADFAEDIKKREVLTADNIECILRREVGRVFTAVLEDAGVYKCTPEGRRAMLRFVDFVNSVK